ncbi:hypothetical protein SPONL_2078 [uncultured Candidatus Thioglobus sp.]|nr:hypothetical protein SPONL_2078 [uncultured Candidatus Thioglobus sp.]
MWKNVLSNKVLLEIFVLSVVVYTKVFFLIYDGAVYKVKKIEI